MKLDDIKKLRKGETFHIGEFPYVFIQNVNSNCVKVGVAGTKTIDTLTTAKLIQLEEDSKLFNARILPKEKRKRNNPNKNAYRQLKIYGVKLTQAPFNPDTDYKSILKDYRSSLSQDIPGERSTFLIGKIQFSISTNNLRLTARIGTNLTFIGVTNDDGFFKTIKAAEKYVEDNKSFFKGCKSMRGLLSHLQDLKSLPIKGKVKKSVKGSIKQIAEKPIKGTDKKSDKKESKKSAKKGLSNKAKIYLSWKAGEIIVKKLSKIAKGEIKDTTIKAWMSKWKNKNGIPAGV